MITGYGLLALSTSVAFVLSLRGAQRRSNLHRRLRMPGTRLLRRCAPRNDSLRRCGRHDPPTTFAEADRHRARAPAMRAGTPRRHRPPDSGAFRRCCSVIVSRPPKVISSRQPMPVASVPDMVPLPNRSPGPQIAAVRRMVRDHLRHGPVQLARIGAAHPMRLGACGTHRRRGQEHLAVDVERAMRLVGGIEQMRQRLRIAVGPRGLRDAERLAAPPP